MKHVVRGALMLLASAVLVPTLWATTAVERSESELIREAAVIVTGRCIQLQPQWIDRDLVTLATIQVTEALKGNPGTQLTVVIPGGIDANRPFPVAVTFPAAPEIFEQESVLLFLTEEDRVVGGYAVAGFSQGKFTLVESAGKKLATQDLSALSLQGRNGQISRGTSKAISVDQLRHKIKEVENAQ